MINLAIIITAYNRPKSLDNLLKNLLRIRTSIKLPLIISIDNGGTPEVNRIAYNFEWTFGEKKVIIHPNKLGLVNHFIWVGDQTEEYEHVLFLEDDLLTSPEIINYSLQLINFYENESNVAAASLYNPILIEATGTKFYQLQDEYDVYFLQQPYWGNIWFRNKWRDFKDYLKTYSVKPELLPSNVASWDRSFKKKYIQYLAETGKTVVTPRISIVTNNGNAGIHGGDMYSYQTVLCLEPRRYRFPKVDQSKSIYDCFEEISPDLLKLYNSRLAEYDFCVDLLGTRTLYPKEYVLTTRKSQNPIMCFSSLMKPTELSIVLNTQGDKGIVLTKVSDIVYEKSYERKRRYKDILKNYYIGVYASFYISMDLIRRLIRTVIWF